MSKRYIAIFVFLFAGYVFSVLGAAFVHDESVWAWMMVGLQVSFGGALFLTAWCVHRSHDG